MPAATEKIEFMDEKPKSIWKKSWNGRSAILFWSLLVATVISWMILFVAFVNLSRPLADNFMPVAMIGFAGVIVGLCCFFWNPLRRALFVLACFVTLLALFYAEEDRRGWHAWQKFKHEWEAKGEKFDLASLAPPAVPDDQNFALTPIVASSYETFLDKNGHALRPRNTNIVNRLQMSINDDNVLLERPASSDWRMARTSDLKAWQNYYRLLAAKTNEFPVPSQPQSPAADVLLALSKYNSTLEELRQNGQLPCSRFPLEYDKDDPSAMTLSHLAVLKGCAQVLEFRAIAELQNEHSDQALADIKLILRLADSIRTEPILISHLVRIALVNFALQPVWEGLAERKWSDAQFAAIDQELNRLDFLADYKLAMRGECADDVGTIGFLERHRNRSNFNEVFDWGDDVAILYYFGPNGWFEQSKLRIGRFFVEQYLPLANVDRQTVSPASVRNTDALLRAATKHEGLFNFLERMLLPELGTVAKRFAYAQTSVDLARVAIALEHYRLMHGEYPESLDALAPQFIAKLPHDVINGQPLHYRRTSDGQFVLYSVGWNETDDGGVVETKVVGVTDRKSQTPIWDISQGDWVWRYPAR